MNKILIHLQLFSTSNSPLFTDPLYSQFCTFNFRSSLLSKFFSHQYYSKNFGKVVFTSSKFTNFLQTPIKLTAGGNIHLENRLLGHEHANYYNTNLVEISRCQFISCKSEDDGGALFLHYATIVHIYHSIFSKCKASNAGGALYISRSTLVKFDQNVFQKNEADFSSGAISFYLVFGIDLLSSNFTGNKSAFKTSTLSFLSSESSQFINNFIIEGETSNGGCLVFDAGISQFSNCVLAKNSGDSALLILDISSVSIKNSLFSKNERLSIDCTSTGKVDLLNVTFTGKLADEIKILNNSTEFFLATHIEYEANVGVELPTMVSVNYVPKPTKTPLKPRNSIANRLRNDDNENDDVVNIELDKEFN